MNNSFNSRQVRYILYALAALFIISGFVCMSGDASSSEYFNSDIFSVRRIRIAPILTLVGYLLIIPAVLSQSE